MTPDPTLIEQLLLALAAIFDRTGCPAMVVTEAAEEGVSISLHFSADRARAFVAGQGSAALPSEAMIERFKLACLDMAKSYCLGSPESRAIVAAVEHAQIDYIAMRATTPTAPDHTRAGCPVSWSDGCPDCAADPAPTAPVQDDDAEWLRANIHVMLYDGLALQAGVRIAAAKRLERIASRLSPTPETDQQQQGASLRDRAGRPPDQAAPRLGDPATIPSAGEKQ
ncbi:hypothetical protein [Sphingomonas sp. URHD0057]|uniref:hypothetical protein n=1 Tax=Sphingomonas sp. URHD0057 TaxID=1380389 RepID=UPI0012DC6D8B|nr:hypothetical protein [Sphingomonas sp. URHD0057]